MMNEEDASHQTPPPRPQVNKKPHVASIFGGEALGGGTDDFKGTAALLQGEVELDDILPESSVSNAAKADHEADPTSSKSGNARQRPTTRTMPGQNVVDRSATPKKVPPNGLYDQGEIPGDAQGTYSYNDTVYGSYREVLGNYAASIGPGTRDPPQPEETSQGTWSIRRALEGLKESILSGFTKENMKEWLYSRNIWVFLFVTSCTATALSWTIDECVAGLNDGHIQFSEYGNNYAEQYFLWVLWRILVGLAAVSITHYVSPVAAGSGIPEMRSILGGFELTNYLTLRTLFAKVFGLILAQGAGLNVGKEGPFVHTSAVVSAQMLKLPAFHQILESPALTHNVLSAACAVGVASTFGAPVGGVLFSIEVTTIFYQTRNYWQGFFAAVVGAFTFKELGYLGNSRNYEQAIFRTNFGADPWKQWELFGFIFLGVFLGALSGYFVKTFSGVVNLRRKYQAKFFGKNPLLFCATAFMIVGLIEYPFGEYMILPLGKALKQLYSAEALSEEDANWGTPNIYFSLVAFSVLKFFFVAIDLTLNIPAGVITGFFAIGAAMGRLFAEIFGLNPGGYAVVGSAAFAAGGSGTVSIAVIVFEMTGQLSYATPILLAVTIGRAVGSWVNTPIFSAIAKDKKLPVWPDCTKQLSYLQTAADVMNYFEADSTCIIHRRTTYQQLRDILDLHQDVQSFPLVDSRETMIFIGSVDRFDVESLVRSWGNCISRANENRTDVDGGHDATGNMGGDMIPASLLGLMKVLSADQKQALSPGLEVDIVSLGLVNLDAGLDGRAGRIHVTVFTSLADLVFFFSIHQVNVLFVTEEGRLVGFIPASSIGDGKY